MANPCVLIMMGVSGCGKTTLAQAVADRLGWAFQEGDALHPPANVAKMRGGTPLTDNDRWPWLARIAEWIGARLAAGESGVVTCSALKRAYRERLVSRPDVRLVYLAMPRLALEQRVGARHHDYMPASLLDSQLATLEPPEADEHPIVLDATGQPDALTESVLRQMHDAGLADHA